MLSASPAEAIRGHEGAVRAFAEIAAEAREEGFILADRAGTITHLSGHGTVLLGRTAQELTGKPLAILVNKNDMEPLRQFLEKPARFAETARPSLAATTEDGDTDITLFAEGQAGVVSGYFGFLRKRYRIAPPAATAAPAVAADDDIEPGMLGRLEPWHPPAAQHHHRLCRPYSFISLWQPAERALRRIRPRHSHCRPRDRGARRRAR